MPGWAYFRAAFKNSGDMHNKSRGQECCTTSPANARCDDTVVGGPSAVNVKNHLFLPDSYSHVPRLVWIEQDPGEQNQARRSKEHSNPSCAA